MKFTLALVLGVLVVGCAEDDPARHLPDAAPIDGVSSVELVVNRAGNGKGTVTSAPVGITCGESCNASFDQHTTVTLTAEADDGSVFSGWSGACSGDAATCEVTLEAATSVTATFSLAKHTVTVNKTGPGAGAVHGGGLECDASCTLEVDHGTELTFTATPAALAVFGGWGGACTGMGDCTVTVTSDVTVSASFALDNFTLFAVKSGNGTGAVTSTPAGINCGTDCDQVYTANQMVTLSATAATGSTFAGWAGNGCTGSGACVVTVTGPKTVTAMFTLRQFALTVAKTGQGTVTGTGINCGADCSESYNYGTNVTLTAAPATGYSFGGWSGGGCTGIGPCTVSIDAAKTVTASFTLNSFALTVTKTGSGTVTGTGINCGTDCTETLGYGTNVTLTATPATGYSFTGWGGACSGTGPCTVTIDAAKTVSATFTINTFALTVTKTGSGTVTGTGINCGSDCSETLSYGTNVTLTATPATGYSFTGWGGACSGTGPCTVTIDAAKTVSATFTINTFALSVTKTGSGTVTGTGINCGTDCSETYNYNTSVTLTATPATGYSFTGWGGACSGTGACTVTMNAAKSVTATFTQQTFALTVTKTGNGSVAGTGITCGTDCSETLAYGTTVTLTAMPATGSSFVGWGGACSGTGSCTVTITAATNVSATFALQTFPLTVTKSGNGTVTGTGISCGSDCSETFNYGTNATLTATPAQGSTFVGWSGACTGNGTCTVSMTAARAVTANFVALVTLSVDKSGAGTVTGGGVNCGSNCSVSVVPGTVITLTASPSTANATASTFVGWSGACTGTGNCTLTLNSNMSVTAGFKLKPNIMFVTSQTYNGALDGLAGADKKCQSAADAVGLPGTYIAYLSAVDQTTLVNARERVGGATGWVRVDGKPVMDKIEQMQTGLFNTPSVMENGVDVTQTQFDTAWTGTNNQGTFHSQCKPVNNAIEPWNGPAGSAMVGHATDTTFRAATWDNFACDVPRRLYCLGIDRAALSQ